MKKLSGALMLVILPGLAGAGRTVGAQFLNVPLSVRQMGMGGVGVGGHDLLRAWTNPSALAVRERRGELGFVGSSMFEGEQSTFGFGAGWMLRPGWSIGALVSAYSLSIPEVDVDGRSVGANLERGAQAGALATAMSFGFTRLGVAVKLISDTVPGDRASALAADLGMGADWKIVSASLAFRNAGGTLRTGMEGGGPDELLPTELRAGLAFHFRPRGIVVAAEATQVSGLKSRVAAGLEWKPAEFFGLRVGFADFDDAAGRYSAGLSAAWKGMGMDYAMAAHPAGMTHTASLSFAFGPTVRELADAQVSAQAVRAAERDAAATQPSLSELGGAGVAPEAAPPPPAAVAGAARSTLAVAAFDSQNVSAGDAAVIADMFRAELVKQGRFDIVEKSNMDKVLAEQAFQQSGCTTAECAVKLGKILNVKYLIVGSFGKLMDQYLVTFRMVETETAKVVHSDAVRQLSTQQHVYEAISAMTARLGQIYGTR